MKKNVYFIQVSDIYGTDKKSVYIPYAVGCIQAYCQKNSIITDNYNFGKFIYTKEPVDSVIDRLENPYMLFFSCAVWNMEYNKALASAVKKAYPECLITFGGHNVSSDGTELKKYSFVDFVIHRFGEEPAEGLLVNLALGKTVESISNISLRGSDGDIITTRYEAQKGVSYPSPYLEGTFDEILKDDISFSGLFESNRGCPNACSFCDWSELGSKVRLFSMEKVKAELDWFAENKIEYVYCVDANFCLFDRDAEIADYVVQCKEKYGYPKVFRVFFTKNRFDFVFDVSTRFFRSGLDKAKTISFQSMDEQVLKNIGRKNIPVEFFKKLLVKYKELGIDTLSELILGLPGETYDSFCNGINVLLQSGQHFAISIYPCEILPNSQMGQKAYMEKFGIKSTTVPFKLIHSIEDENKDKITEYSQYITATNSMNEKQWAESLLFSNYIQGLHNLGLLRAVAVYICNEYKISYSDFYQKLIAWSENNKESFLNSVYKKISDLCHGITKGKNEMFATFEKTGNILWGFDELIYLNFFDNKEVFYNEAKAFVRSCFESNPIIDALFDYQSDIIKKTGNGTLMIESDYDFFTYFNNIYSDKYYPLQKNHIILKIQDKIKAETLTDYAREVVWYGRNKRATDYTSSCYEIQYSAYEKK